MKNLPNLAAGTTPMEVVLVSAAAGQPPIAREVSPGAETPARDIAVSDAAPAAAQETAQVGNGSDA